MIALWDQQAQRSGLPQARVRPAAPVLDRAPRPRIVPGHHHRRQLRLQRRVVLHCGQRVRHGIRARVAARRPDRHAPAPLTSTPMSGATKAVRAAGHPPRSSRARSTTTPLRAQHPPARRRARSRAASGPCRWTCTGCGWRCSQLESAHSAEVVARNSSQLTDRSTASRPNHPAAMAANPRTLSAEAAVTLNACPAASLRRSTARANAWATSSAWTWCISSVPRPGITSSEPAERCCQTLGSRLPTGLITGHPGPLMCPGCSDVVTSPPASVSARRSAAMAAFCTPYSPNGSLASSSVIGTLLLMPCLQMEPQWIRWSTKPAQPLDERAGRLGGEAHHVDHHVGLEVADVMREHAPGVLGLAIDGDLLDRVPGGVVDVRLSDAATQADHLVAGPNQSRDEERADVSGSTDHDNAHADSLAHRPIGDDDGTPHPGTHRCLGQQAVPRHDDVRRLGQPRPRRVDPDHPRRARRGRQLRRHGRRLRARRVGGDRRQGAGRWPARRHRPGHEVPRADGRRPQPAGQLAPVDHPRGRGLAAPPGHGLDRPLPGAPPAHRHRHRGDPRSPHRPRPSGEGPLHRLLDLPRQPDRRGPVDRARPAPAALRHRATGLLDPRPRDRDRHPAHLQPTRHGRHVLQPADRRLALGPLAQGLGPAVLVARRAAAGALRPLDGPPTSASSMPSSSSRSSRTRSASRSSSSPSPSC